MRRHGSSGKYDRGGKRKTFDPHGVRLRVLAQMILVNPVYTIALAARTEPFCRLSHEPVDDIAAVHARLYRSLLKFSFYPLISIT